MKQTLTILGSTGSIGVNTLKVVQNLGGEIEVIGLSAHKNAALLIEQARLFSVKTVAVSDLESAEKVDRGLSGSGIEILRGKQGVLELAGRDNVGILMNGLVGSAGMEPTIKAVKAGVNIALSNKESLVMAGNIIEKEKLKSGAEIFPVDSEHSAIWQCLSGESRQDLKRIILTGSGGPFRTRAVASFVNITPEEALKHPNWDMGAKITVDSATMMNKGLEIIEARWLFDLKPEEIDMIIHPQSIIHSMVEFKDGSVKAQMGLPDMKIPIQYALAYPRHKPAEWGTLDLIETGSLTFEVPDPVRFPSIALAEAALKSGGSTAAVLNVANEQAVYRFLGKEIRFTDIQIIVEQACDGHDWIDNPVLEELKELEIWTTEFVSSFKSKNNQKILN